MVDNFSQKEMLIIMMNKLEIIENKLNDTHELAKVTNGKVKFHTKLIFGLSGAFISVVGWLIITILRSV